MQDEPTPVELAKAVADFLRNDIAPAITGHNAFKLRVAINMLDLVGRQLTLAQGSDAAEAASLRELLGIDGALIDAEPCAGGEDREGDDRSCDAWAIGASVADHDGQACGRSAELWVVQKGVGARSANADALSSRHARPCAEASHVYPSHGL